MSDSKYKLIIFDLDGTILDTIGDLTNSINFALRKGGYPERTVQEIRSFVGNGVRNLTMRALPDGADDFLIDETLALFKAHYAEHINDITRPYKGITELLQRLKSEGYFLAVISNKIDFATKMLVKSHFGDVFDVVFGEREGVPRKPSPQSLFEVMQILSCKEDETVYIGDSEIDIITSRNAGVDCISVLWGFRERSVLEENGATFTAESVDALYRTITTKN